MTAELCIGLDFDNTIIAYDNVFLSTAREWGLVGANFVGRKQAIRDTLRLLPDGEMSWQRLQGHVYGKGLAQAAMFDGVDAFLRRCRLGNATVVIVSHKTEFGHYDPDRVNLREVARDWMAKHGFFCENCYAITPHDVYFEGTRQDKLARIGQLGCTHFIDDLEEILSDPAFPPGVERILFAEEKPASAPYASAPYTVCPSWRHIEERIFLAQR